MFETIGLLSKPDDHNIDRALRPGSLDNYIGQENLVKKLRIAIKAAQDRDEPLDHVLLSGPPGLGKTTIAQIVAAEFGTEYQVIAAPAIKSIADLVEILTKRKYKDVLFLDEIHGLSNKIEEALYSAMEDFKISIKLGNKKLMNRGIAPFCLIGATTKPGNINSALRDRFGIAHTMDYYSVPNLVTILKTNADKLELVVKDDNLLSEIAKRCRGTPRIANKLLRRVRDYCQVHNDNVVSSKMIEECFDLEKIDKYGLSEPDRKYLKTLLETYTGGPVGVVPLAASSGEDKGTIEDYVEPYLVRQQMVARTPRGRVLTDIGMEYIITNKDLFV